ncbi:MAG: ABC transporter permease [Synergistaceae bacterium]|nr:ABC transporter permease [Synergistaceae bacterium]
MARFLLHRFISVLLTIWAVVTVTFLMMHAVPGGPFQQEKQLPDAVIQALEAKYHLNDPLPKQYLDYLKGILTWDLGPSFQKIGVSVEEMIGQSFPVSMKLGLLVVIVVLALGVPLGVLAAVQRGRVFDQFIRFVATLGQTIPSFVLATLLIYVFSARLRWFPSFGLRTWKHYVLPVAALGGYSLSFVLRLTRSTMVEVLQQDYIRTARAKGVPESSVIFRHALRNALIPVVTYIGPLIAAIITGSFVVEKIFAIPGMGKFFVESVTNRDYTVLMGLTLFQSIILCTAILAVDLLYGLLDPRIKVGK